jgi:hypothetical protein
MWAFLRIMFSATLTAIAVPFYLRWSADQAERQFDKMQKAVHFTPGAESPITAEVVVGAGGLGISHFAVGRVLGLRWWQAALSLLAGVAAGTLVFFYRMTAEE